jgi:hypothetical protein
LIPDNAIRQAGWRGAIGIEAKRSGEKLGPIIAQAADYQRAVWSMPFGIDIMLRRVFLWPASETFGAIASFMSQNRIGCLLPSRCDTPLTFWTPTGTAISFDRAWQPHVGNITTGRRAGSR